MWFIVIEPSWALGIFFCASRTLRINNVTVPQCHLCIISSCEDQIHQACSPANIHQPDDKVHYLYTICTSVLYSPGCGDVPVRAAGLHLPGAGGGVQGGAGAQSLLLLDTARPGRHAHGDQELQLQGDQQSQYFMIFISSMFRSMHKG